MRIWSIIALGLLTLKGVAADCVCLQRAARAANCDIDDPECFCESNDYIEALDTCATRSRNDCTEEDLFDARSSFAQVCLRALESTTTQASTSTRTTARTTSTSAPATTTSSRTSTSTTKSSTTNTASGAPSNNNGAQFSTAQIGGIAGGIAGFVVIFLAVVIFCTMRKYKKKDKKEEVARADDAEKFIEGGRQFRAASMTTNPNDRLYSTRRPLSYALGEYDSSRYDNQDDHDHHAQVAGAAGYSSSGNYNNRGAGYSPDEQSGYFNRFSGNYMEDSTQAFERRQPQNFQQPPSSYRAGQRSASVPMPMQGPAVPTASLSYEEYRNHGYDQAGEHTGLMNDSSSGYGPHRSVSAPYSQRVSRKPIGNSVSERTSGYYPPQSQYQASSSTEAQSSLMGYDNRRFSMGDRDGYRHH